jgi:hypothetical protein
MFDRSSVIGGEDLAHSMAKRDGNEDNQGKAETCRA